MRNAQRQQMPPPRLTSEQLEAWNRGTITANKIHDAAVAKASAVDPATIPEMVAYGEIGDRERQVVPARDLAVNSARWIRGER